MADPTLAVEHESSGNQPPGDGPRLQRIGPYHILELLGEGGMGEVYKAERRHPMRQTVAIKIIKLGFNSREVIARFESERQALARMDHPHVARVLDAGTTDIGRPYFVMEYAPGKPITEFADDNKLNISDRLLLFCQACEAIAHAHAKAIIHRDLKDSNVLAYLHDGNPTVKVIDFGIAKALTADRLTEATFNTESGRIIGTYGSMSPEQAEGSPDIDTRTDVYSLGVLLYELLTGVKPFDFETLAQAADEEIRRIIRQREPPRPSTRLSTLGDTAMQIAALRREPLESLERQLRRELEWIPLKAMRKERDRRYASALQLADDVRSYLAGRPLLAAPESQWYRFKKWLRRHASELSFTLGLLALIVAGFGLFLPLVTAVVSLATLIAVGLAVTIMYVRSIRIEQAKTRDALEEAHRERAEAEKQRNDAVLRRAEAERQRAAAEAVNQFLNEMLASANPKILYRSDGTKGRRMSILDVLNHAAAKIDSGAFKAQPDVEATVRSTIGVTCFELGEYTLGERHLRTALELNRHVHGEAHGKVVASLRQLADLLREAGKLTEAEPLLREALTMARKLLGEENLDVASTLDSLATVLQFSGKLQEAEQLFRQSLAMERRLLSDDDPHLAVSLNNLAALLYEQGKLSEAEPLFRDVLARYRRTLGNEHAEVATTLNNLCVVAQKQGKLAEAEALAREALTMRRRLLGAEHPDVGQSLNNLANVLRDQGKPFDAEPFMREALEMNQKLLGGEHMVVATNLHNLARLLRDQGRLAEVEPLLLQAIAIRRKKFGAHATPTTQSTSALAELLDYTGRHDEAAALREQMPRMPASPSPPLAPQPAAAASQTGP